MPITLSAAGAVGRRHPATVVGRVTTIGYIGSVIGPMMIGTVTHVAGLRVGLVLPVALAISIVLAADAVAPATTGRVVT